MAENILMTADYGERFHQAITNKFLNRNHTCVDLMVNLSSVWLLPEEGYPVFYRYFRDRITWYEADAVCQFHHGQLIIVDSSSEFDAARAYLKELDVANFVWTGLKRLSSKQNFLWPDSKSMENAEGHWAVEIPKMDEPLCAAIDPSSDYRWQPLPCSGPTVAAFICQMQVPTWAQTEDGCMLTSLPSLTVTFLPEQGAVELISDCGLEGTRRIACKGQAKREEMMRQLSCETSTEPASSDTWDDQPTRHRRESEVTQDMSSHPNTTQDMGTTDEESSTTEQTITTEPASTADETSVEDPAKNITSATTTHSPTQSHVELALPMNDQPAAPEISPSSSTAPQVKRPLSSKPIPPSLKGNSPFVETPAPLVTPTKMNVSDETEAPPESHESLGGEGDPTHVPASLGTNPSLEQYKKNIHDSGEDHTEETNGSSITSNITSVVNGSTLPTTPDMLADEPDLPERPNRGRLLVHPQHHSFYAYFLNRVLG